MAKAKKERKVNPYAPGQGSQTEARFKLVLGGTNIQSEIVKEALRLCYVDGFDEKLVVMKTKVTQSNFRRNRNLFDEVHVRIEKIKELDWVNFIKSQ